MAVAPTPELLQQVARLATMEHRVEAAREIARSFGGSDLLILLRDQEVNALLPAPGFAQTFPNGKLWRAFLAECVRRGEYRGELPVRHAGAGVPAAAFCSGQDSVFLVLGAQPTAEDVLWFRELMPLLVVALSSEQTAQLAGAEARIAQDSAARAALLMQTVDRTRLHLEEALRSAEASRNALQDANTQLSDQAVEMELASDHLREQAAAEEQLAELLEKQAEELMATNKQLEDARAVAESANKAKSEFLATMSHELRTPLNAIGGHVALLAMGLHGPVTAEQQSALTRVDRNQRHLLGLINDVLNLSRIEAGKVDYRIVDVSLAAAMEDLGPMITPQLAEKSLAYQVALPAPLPPVRADREKLDQILLNLLSNAVKFTPAGGRVWVDAKVSDREPGKVYLRVSDTGLGIPREKLESIFEPFTQVDGSHSRMGQGTGLGLAISRDLARGMGGDLRARSKLGSGSAFTLTLDSASAKAPKRALHQ